MHAWLQSVLPEIIPFISGYQQVSKTEPLDLGSKLEAAHRIFEDKGGGGNATVMWLSSIDRAREGVISGSGLWDRADEGEDASCRVSANL